MALRQTSGPFPKSTLSKPHCWQQCSIWADPTCFLKADQREPSQSATLHSTASHGRPIPAGESRTRSSEAGSAFPIHTHIHEARHVAGEEKHGFAMSEGSSDAPLETEDSKQREAPPLHAEAEQTGLAVTSQHPAGSIADAPASQAGARGVNVLVRQPPQQLQQQLLACSES